MSSRQTISELAYHLWRARGCPEGSPDVDWHEAERQVTGRVSADSPSDSQQPEGPAGAIATSVNGLPRKRATRARATKAEKKPSPKKT
jgi:hypothetical protein